MSGIACIILYFLGILMLIKDGYHGPLILIASGLFCIVAEIDDIWRGRKK